MGGGLLQIVAYGSQDIYLTGNPQITFFKAVYRRHTNFSMESIKQIFNGTADFGQEVSVTLQRNADLIYKTYLQVKLPNIDVSEPNTSDTYSAFRWLNWIGHVLIKNVEGNVQEKSFSKSVDYNNRSNKFELKKYEDQTSKILAEKISDEIIVYLQSI